MKTSILYKFVQHVLLFVVVAGNFLLMQAQTVDLPISWKFKIGDNPEWSNPSFNDSLWDIRNVRSSWSAKDLKANVFAWYRTKINIPSSMKSAIEKGNGLKLSLGKIDDVDFTYFNGKLVGQLGSLPPNYVTKWDIQRAYIIPPMILFTIKKMSLLLECLVPMSVELECTKALIRIVQFSGRIL